MTSVVRVLLVMGIVSLVATACSNIRLMTNTGPVVLGNAMANGVDVYNQDEIFRHNYQDLGVVSTSYCETSHDVDKRDRFPDESSMEAALQRQVSQRGGNALVIKTCGRVNYPACIAYIECEGVAYLVKD